MGGRTAWLVSFTAERFFGRGVSAARESLVNSSDYVRTNSKNPGRSLCIPAAVQDDASKDGVLQP